LQLYTVRDQLAQDFEGTMREVADIGYVGVETANMFGDSPTVAAKLFKELGLTVSGAHSPLPLGDQKQEVIDTMGALDCKRLIVAWQPPEKYKSFDGIKSICDTLNEGAAVAKANGFQLGYHNHWFEYQSVENRIPIDVMLEHLDPDVFFEVDVYWVQTAGQKPVEVVRHLGARAPLLHIKDGPCVIEAPMTALGEGVVDIPDVVAAGTGSTEWLVVELDHCATDMMEAVQKSYRYLVEKGLGRGNKN
ncbi:MAG TPA: sugar phosphate isomerase/epimerase, partial [Anaerolineales bacterium]|nr:sugar phosphate isomerase/epimerase [Anaerolineales bacterium]